MSIRSLQLPPVKNLEELSALLQEFKADIRDSYICSLDRGTKGNDAGKNLIIFDEAKSEASLPMLREFPGAISETELAQKATALEAVEKLPIRAYGNVLLGKDTSWVVLYEAPAARLEISAFDPNKLVFAATTQKFSNKKATPDSFLRELVIWARSAPDEIFAERITKEPDVYDSVRQRLGPYRGLLHRKACMLEVLRVLGGFESEWNWNEGIDQAKAKTLKQNSKATEAGLWQVSADSLAHGEDLQLLVRNRVGSNNPLEFQGKMKSDHLLAMEYVARLLRHTVRANGPVKRHDIDPFLSVKAVAEFQQMLAA